MITSLQELGYTNHRTHPRLNCYKPHAQKTEQTFAQEISASLTLPMRSISPKFFYDDYGSELFEKICDLSEYYITRTETGILNQIRDELASHLTDNMRLVELGSGSSVKTRLVLDAFQSVQEKTEYFPIDISDILAESCQKLLDEYDTLHITGVIDTYHEGLKFVKNYDATPNLIVFLGSSFGNFDEQDGLDFLKKIRSSMKDSDLFLIGLDLAKDKDVLESAYDDSLGITAKFNLNVLSRINRELDGDFDPSQFSHVAKFNEKKQRIEMYLQSNERQTVKIPKSKVEIHLDEGELIHTEHSHKYTVPGIKTMLADSGFNVSAVWQDEKKYYCLVLCSASSGRT